jgi:hypothetical protein
MGLVDTYLHTKKKSRPSLVKGGKVSSYATPRHSPPTSPSYSSSSSSGSTSTSSSGGTTSRRARRSPAQRRASRIKAVARITKPDPVTKAIRQKKPTIRAKAEDSFSERKTSKLVDKGYTFRDGAWRTPKADKKYYSGYFEPKKESNPNSSPFMRKLITPKLKRQVKRAYKTGEIIDIRGTDGRARGKTGRRAEAPRTLLRRETPTQLSKRTATERGQSRKPYQKQRIPEDPKIQGRKEKVVAKKLTKAARKSQGGLAAKVDRGFEQGYAGDDLESITKKQAAIIAEAHGLPGITYSEAIIPGESNFRPGVRNPDDATPSLFQITPSVQSSETQAKFDKIASKHKGGYANPIAAAKMARVLAGDSADEGVSNYVAHNPSAPHGHLPGGQKAARQKLYGKKKPIPQALKRKATKVLGKETAKKVVEKAKSPTSSVPKKQPGAYAGTQGIVRELIGPKYAKKVDWKDKEPREGTGSMHDTDNPSSFAADISIDEGGLDTEKLVDRIAKKLGLDPKEVNYGTTGLESGITYKGYAIEFLPYRHGSGDHVHIAAEWTGEGLPPGTVSGGSVSSGTTSGTTPSYGGAATSSGKGTTPTKKARRQSEGARSRKQLLNEILNTPDAEATDALAGYTRPTASKTTKTTGLSGRSTKKTSLGL